MIPPDFYLFADPEAGRHIGHRLVVAARDMPAGDEIAGLAGLAGAARHDADDHGPHIAFAPAYLHGEVGDVGGPGHAGHAEDAAIKIVIQTR